MKNTIYKIGLLLFAFALVSSCESPEAETNYSPAQYEFPGNITLDASNVTNSSFDLTYSNIGGGEGYYVVVEGDSPIPSNQQVFDGTAAGQIDSGSFDLTGEPVTIEIGGGDLLCDGTSFSVYAVQFTSDSFLSESPASVGVTTIANLEAGPGVTTYDAVSNGFNGWFGIDVVDLVGTINVTNNGDGTFEIDDWTGGWYAEFYSQYGATGQGFTATTIECNVARAVYPSQFAGCCDDFIDATTVINFDGTGTITWSNSFFGDSVVTVITLQ